MVRTSSRIRPVASTRLVTAIALALLVSGPADAGTLHASLAARLETMTPNEKVGAILILAEQAPIEVVSASLRARQATRQERHREIVLGLQRTAARTQGVIRDRLDRLQAEGQISGYTCYWISNIIVVHGSRSAIFELSARPDVDHAELNFEAGLISPMGFETDPPKGDVGENRTGTGATSGIRTIQADRVWYELGVTGVGALVANLDTGVDGTHPALADRWRGLHTPWEHAWHDVLGTNTTFPTDTAAHGTHVMGTITGLGEVTGDSIGVAPGAEWIAANACNQNPGSTFDNDILDCYQWFADPDGNVNTVDDVPDVVQNSWGVSAYPGFDYTVCDMRWSVAMDNLEAAGTVLTFSAGNSGPGPMTMLSPADRTTTPLNSFSVGAIDGRGSYPHPIAAFSSRGPSGCPGNAMKPEVVAPGVGIYSCVPGGGYYDLWQGTSLAGPHVAGAVALMRSADPDLEVDEIKQILLETAVDHGIAGEDNDYGWGVLDAYAAVLAVTSGSSEVLDEGGAASRTGILSSLPNPFTGDVTIQFAVSKASPVRIGIFDVRGRLLRTILNETRLAGLHTVAWDGEDDLGRGVSVGVYLCRMDTRDSTSEWKLLRVE